MTKRINGLALQGMICCASAALGAQQQAINDLNVFPVPDGDTGTNMSMTIQAAALDAEHRPQKHVGEAASAAASAMLRGARGNSGVILSLLFRGISKSLKGKDECDGLAFANALGEGVTAAYSAVMKPAEGTILTVSRLSAKAALEAAGEKNDMKFVLTAAVKEAERALADTIEQNPVLKKAGVVDAGGKGFTVILQGMLSSLCGKTAPETVVTELNDNAFTAVGDGEITFTFDTVFVVRKNGDTDLTGFRTYLNGIGDSLVIGEDDETFKVHVHTDVPGEVLSEAQKYGVLELAKIENMRTQYEDVAQGRKAQSTDDLSLVEEELEHETVAPAEKPFGFLAVCAGEGLSRAFRDLGTDAVVSGGQTMNPSTESILNAVNSVPAETVFVLPNNKNIIMAAQQCVGLTEKQVVVIPSASVPQGISAMMAVNFDAKKAESIEKAMNDALGGVSTAQITYAARDSDFDGFAINEGDYLALLDGKLFATSGSIEELLEKLAAEAKDRGAGFISVFYGEDVSEEAAETAVKIFERVVSDAEVSVLSGGQPVYYYIISME